MIMASTGDIIDITPEALRAIVFYQFRLNESAAEGHRKLCETLGPSVVGYSTVARWMANFKKGNYTFEDKPRPGPAVTVDDDAIRELIEADSRMSVRQLKERLGYSETAIRNHLHALGKTWKYGVWIPHEITPVQISARLDAVTILLSFKRDTGWIRDLVTGDEKWVFYVTHSRKKQWLGKGETGIPTPKDDLHPKKTMISVFWNMNGVIHFELLAPNTTVNSDLYCAQLDTVAAKLHRVQDKVYFLHDNARPHVSSTTRAKLQQLKWSVLPHPPYSPDLSPTDYHVFRSLVHDLENKTFDDREDLQIFLNGWFAQKPKEFWQRGIAELPTRWQHVLDNNGAYIC